MNKLSVQDVDRCELNCPYDLPEGHLISDHPLFPSPSVSEAGDKNSGEGSKEHRAVPSTESAIISKSDAAPLVKIFALNDCEWWAGYDVESVKAAFLAQEYGDEGSFDEPHELPDSEMDRLTWVTDLASFPEGDVPITFRQRLDQMVAGAEAFPCFFASTEY